MRISARARYANEGDLGALARLFDGYRQFYGQASDEAAASRFLGDRLANRDSVLIIAESEGEGVGFAQLYPSFTSIGMARILILNDLFVAPERRGLKLGKELLDAAIVHARAAGAVRLTLSTGIGNRVAQAMYEDGGWVRDDRFYVYNLEVKA